MRNINTVLQQSATSSDTSNLKVREHVQQAPQQAAVDGLATALPLDQQQDPIDGLTLNLKVTDDVESKQLQAHVPEIQKA